MTRLWVVAVALLGVACSERDPAAPVLRGRASDPAARTLEDGEWLGAPAAQRPDGGALVLAAADGGGLALPAPGRPWTAGCGRVVEHLAALTRATLAADGATASELALLDRRAAQEHDSEVARCAARAEEAEITCLLAARRPEDLSACRPIIQP